MWQYNYDYLAHSTSHKYKDKYVGADGKIRYVYDKAHDLMHTPIKDLGKRKQLKERLGVLVRKTKTDKFVGRR